MAPSAVETTTVVDAYQPTSTKVQLTGGVGPYKELAPVSYEKEAEEKGIDGFSAAKVLSQFLNDFLT